MMSADCSSSANRPLDGQEPTAAMEHWATRVASQASVKLMVEWSSDPDWFQAAYLRVKALPPSAGNGLTVFQQALKDCGQISLTTLVEEVERRRSSRDNGRDLTVNADGHTKGRQHPRREVANIDPDDDECDPKAAAVTLLIAELVALLPVGERVPLGAVQDAAFVCIDQIAIVEAMHAQLEGREANSTALSLRDSGLRSFKAQLGKYDPAEDVDQRGPFATTIHPFAMFRPSIGSGK